MRRPQGYLTIVNPEGKTIERDTFTCNHCQRIVIVQTRQDPSDCGGFCRVCFKNICGPCADLGKCTPFEKKLEQQEKRARFFKSIGM